MTKDISEIAKLTECISRKTRSQNSSVPLAEEYKKIGDIETAIDAPSEGLKIYLGHLVTARSFLGGFYVEH